MAAEALLHFEDFAVGESRDFGRYPVTADEIKAFARRFDPQPFHVDEEAAKASILGGLCASGWHTGAMLMRMIVDGYLGQSASLGSPGLDELKWLRPVFPGETLTARFTVIAKRQSARTPEMGIIIMLWEVFSIAGEKKMEVKGVNLIRLRRP
jgi:acyl dehydratase